MVSGVATAAMTTERWSSERRETVVGVFSMVPAFCWSFGSTDMKLDHTFSTCVCVDATLAHAILNQPT